MFGVLDLSICAVKICLGSVALQPQFSISVNASFKAPFWHP